MERDNLLPDGDRHRRGRRYRPRSLNPGWLSGRRPCGQRYRRSSSTRG